jgi:hypothetical protein
MVPVHDLFGDNLVLFVAVVSNCRELILCCEESNGKMSANGERVRIWKEAVMAYVKILSEHSAGKTKTRLSGELVARQRFGTDTFRIKIIAVKILM